MRRSLRSEFSTVAMVLSVPAAVAIVFPYGSLRFRPVAGTDVSEATAAFVDITDEAEQLAIKSSKDGWKVADVGEWRIDMSFGDLPVDRPRPVLEMSVRGRPAPAGAVAFAPSPYLPSLAAPPPAKIEADSDAGRELAFPREELLRLN